MDKFRIDSHKMMYHVSRVSDWLQGDLIYPIYAEISPSGSCNHRCTYCALDFMEYQPRFLDAGILKERLSELGKLGLKSIMYAGEGEPFLHKDMAAITHHTKKSGIDVAFTTNGVLFDKTAADAALKDITWIKVSINGATRETYALIHRTRPEDFDRVMRNMSYAKKAKDAKRLSCTLGMQIILLPENRHEIVLMAKKARDIGMDYLVVKPYSQHPSSKTKKYKDIRYNDYLRLADELRGINTGTFSVIFRMNTMQKWDEGSRTYSHCLALPFWTYIDAGGNVWGCSIYLGDDRFCYGNIYEQSFRKIWLGEKRRRSLAWVAKHLDTADCRVNCRMDEINRYLWELKHPSEHINFI